MKNFTGWQYLLIDCANHFGLDKELFENRILWVEKNLDRLEELADDAPAKTRPLYRKAVMAIRDAQAGRPSGHLVGFDAICSGMQIMSTLTGCHKGAAATGLIDTGERPDAYSKTTEEMGRIMGGQYLVDRDAIKQGVMTMLYGSKEEPKRLFGEDTPELQGFYQAVYNVAPGAYELLQALLNSWQPMTLMHRWVLPDGFVARVRVMQKVESRIEVDELDHATFTYEWYENQGSMTGVANVANTVHSIDAYILRSLIRRCNYDPEQTRQAMEACFIELMNRDMQVIAQDFQIDEAPEAIQKYVERFQATNMVDAVIIPHLHDGTVRYLSDDHLRRLNQMMEEMLDHKPFPIVAIHDEFTAHPNNLNVLRQQYINLFAELAESTILDDIFQTLTGMQGTYRKLGQGLSHKIRNSNYALS